LVHYPEINAERIDLFRSSRKSLRQFSNFTVGLPSYQIDTSETFGGDADDREAVVILDGCFSNEGGVARERFWPELVTTSRPDV
jgi:hypothetical protein